MDAQPEIIEKVAALEAVCAKYSVPLAAAALQFPLMHPAVASVVCGVASPAEVASQVTNLELDIPNDLWRGFKEAGLLGGSVPIVPRAAASSL